MKMDCELIFLDERKKKTVMKGIKPIQLMHWKHCY